MSQESEELHILGKITGYYGVKGWVKIYSYTQPKENIVRYKALQIKRSGSAAKRSANSEWQAISLDSGKVHGKGVVAHFIGYDNREIAAELIGSELAVSRSEFKATAKDEYYWTDLIKLNVVNLQGVELGQVERLMETAANDVLVIRPLQQADAEILIPFVQEYYIKNIDLKVGKIIVDWPIEWNDSQEEEN